jgi:hyperosmotically inducible protein
MRKNSFAILGALAIALLAVACGESDAGITTKVRAKLMTDRSVTGASHIDVSTEKRVVTLSGTAETPEAKERAVLLAHDTEGVARVVDNLTLAPPPAPPGGTAQAVSDAAGKVTEVVDDTAITTAVKTKLLADSATSGTKIHVDTKDGVVTLTGTVKSNDEKEKAVQITRDTKGVQRVEDQLRVRSS